MAKPFVKFPDAVLHVVEFLRAVMPPGTVIRSQVPEIRPATFIRVKRVGGQRNSAVTERPRMDIHAWAPTEGEARDLMEDARAHALTLRAAHEVGGPQWLPDDASGSPRYAFAFEFTLRGE